MSLPTTPRLWPYEPLNSPLPLPQQPVIFSEDELFWIEAEPIESESMSVDELKNTVSDWKSASGDSIDSILSKLGVPLMQERHLFYWLGSWQILLACTILVQDQCRSSMFESMMFVALGMIQWMLEWFNLVSTISP